jgi:hypothetical protein
MTDRTPDPNRRAYVHNAISDALGKAGDWVPLSTRIAATRAALAEVDAWHAAGAEPAVPSAPAASDLTPYRRLLARLEADRAGHLRAAGQTTDGRLCDVGSSYAAALHHAAVVATAEFEGAEAAQEYAQQTSGGGAGEGDAVQAAAPDLRERVARALAEDDGHPWDTLCVDTQQHYLDNADAALAVLPAPADRAAVRCGSCEHEARYHDVDGRCWFTVEHGVPERDAVCACQLRRVADEAQQAGRAEVEPKRTPMNPIHILGIGSEDREEAAALRARLLARLAEARANEAEQDKVRCTCGGWFPIRHLHADTHQPAAETQQAGEGR